MSCCDKTLKLPVQTYCSEIELPITAPADGIYTFIKKNRKVIAARTFDENDNIKIDNVFNENETLLIQVLDPNMDVIKHTVNGVEYDCFQIQIIPIKKQ